MCESALKLRTVYSILFSPTREPVGTQPPGISSIPLPIATADKMDCVVAAKNGTVTSRGRPPTKPLPGQRRDGRAMSANESENKKKRSEIMRSEKAKCEENELDNR